MKTEKVLGIKECLEVSFIETRTHTNILTRSTLLNYLGLIIAGGGKGPAMRIGLVEVFVPSTGQVCKLKYGLPGVMERYGLSMEGTMACGGGFEARFFEA